mmetsp:Transcript_42183/g.103014  ORF Transcript_42183/g.103014 Transcript_42183/m.103014 type:complete len:208 (-) Transcript_42183:212-835(-)
MHPSAVTFSGSSSSAFLSSSSATTCSCLSSVLSLPSSASASGKLGSIVSAFSSSGTAAGRSLSHTRSLACTSSSLAASLLACVKGRRGRSEVLAVSAVSFHLGCWFGPPPGAGYPRGVSDAMTDWYQGLGKVVLVAPGRACPLHTVLVSRAGQRSRIRSGVTTTDGTGTPREWGSGLSQGVISNRPDLSCQLLCGGRKVGERGGERV